MHARSCKLIAALMQRLFVVCIVRSAHKSLPSALLSPSSGTHVYVYRSKQYAYEYTYMCSRNRSSVYGSPDGKRAEHDRDHDYKCERANVRRKLSSSSSSPTHAVRNMFCLPEQQRRRIDGPQLAASQNNSMYFHLGIIFGSPLMRFFVDANDDNA